MNHIRDNIERVRERMALAATKAGRNPEDITLIAVTKTVDVDRVRQAIATGMTDLGENYYQEFNDKAAAIIEPVNWHFIGHLQSNKARYLTGRVSLIHSVDSLSLAQEIGKRSVSASVIQPVLLEIKLDPAETKFGISPEQCIDTAQEMSKIDGIRLDGLMGMAPYGSEPEMARPYFQALNKAFQSLPPENRRVLSIGMTADFETAIEEGATHVRIGTAIFGSRNP